MTILCNFSKVLNKIEFAILNLLSNRLICLRIEFSIVVLMLTKVSHVICKDADITVCLRTADNNTILITLGFERLFAIGIKTCRASFIPHWGSDNTIEILTLSQWFLTTSLKDWVGFKVKIPLFT